MVLCSYGRSEELGYLINTYFSASRPVCSVIDLWYLFYYLMSNEKLESRRTGLNSKKQETFEKALLEQRLYDEIKMILEGSNGFFLSHMIDKDPNQEVFHELHTGDSSNQETTINGFYSMSETTIHGDLKKMMDKFDEFLPTLLSKLVVIPDKIATDCLRMINSSDFDSSGNFKLSDIVAPGVNMRVVDFDTLNRDASLLDQFKPDHIIMYDQSNYWIRNFQFGGLITHKAKLDIIVGSSYMEGWLYDIRDKREDQLFIKLTKKMGILHMVKASAVDRVRLDSGLKGISKKEQSNEALSISSINSEGPVVLIDKREFNSDCPGLLYFNGYKIIPMFLKVGDYILSNDIVIERKVSLLVTRHLMISKVRL